MRTLGIILVIIAMLLLGWKYHNDWCDCCCDKNDTTEVITPVEESIVRDSGPLLFNWSNGAPIYGEGWGNYRDSLVSNLGDNQNLQVTGYYRNDESNNTAFPNLGLARADSLKNALSAHLSADRVTTVGRLVDPKAGQDRYPFISADFKYLLNSANIKEIDDRTLIYFPFNSTNKLNDSEVEAYLDDVAERVAKSGEKVYLTGYTDAVGSDVANLALGQRRADIVKNYLLSKGLNASQIVANSKGEAEPIGDNNTSPGMAMNRRTELIIK